MCIGCSFWVEILCPVLFVHWNLKNLKNLKNLLNLKNLHTFSKKPRFFPALLSLQCLVKVYDKMTACQGVVSESLVVLLSLTAITLFIWSARLVIVLAAWESSSVCWRQFWRTVLSSHSTLFSWVFVASRSRDNVCWISSVLDKLPRRDTAQTTYNYHSVSTCQYSSSSSSTLMKYDKRTWDKKHTIQVKNMTRCHAVAGRTARCRY